MSNRHGPDGESTMRTVRDRADGLDAAHPRRYSGTAIAIPEIPEHISRPLSMLVGFAIGAVLLVLAAVAYYAGGTWSAIDRSGAAVAYYLTGFFLTVAGLGCAIGTWNHHFRVLRSNPDEHHH